MEVIKKWRDATEELAKVFLKKYYLSYNYKRDTFWVADEIGSIYCVGSSFYDVNRMIEALELNATYEQLVDYEDLEIEHGMSENGHKPTPINFKNFVKYGNPNPR